MINAYKILLYAAFASVCIVPGAAVAHSTTQDGTISALFHLSPDDDPIIGQPAALYFETKDTTGRLAKGGCDCRVSVTAPDGRTTLLTARQGGQRLTARHTFPVQGVYAVKLVGRPTGTAEFQSFTLSYPLRVSRTAPVADRTPLLILGLLAPAVVGIGYQLFRRRRRS